jgi:hypothetical protein
MECSHYHLTSNSSTPYPEPLTCMNYLAHGWRFAEQPYVVAGTAAPDWLSAIDRKIRLRSRTAAQFVDDPDRALAEIARGVVQHHVDDGWFHGTTAFNELNLTFAVEIRDALPGDEGFRPSFLGHILVELLLDRALAEDDPARLDRYYAALTAIDPAETERAISRLATAPSKKIAPLVPRFIGERFLYDYLDDGRLLMRLNHVMRRVGLPQLPSVLTELFPAMHRRVRERMTELLTMP